MAKKARVPSAERPAESGPLTATFEAVAHDQLDVGLAALDSVRAGIVNRGQAVPVADTLPTIEHSHWAHITGTWEWLASMLAGVLKLVHNTFRLEASHRIRGKGLT